MYSILKSVTVLIPVKLKKSQTQSVRFAIEIDLIYFLYSYEHSVQFSHTIALMYLVILIRKRYIRMILSPGPVDIILLSSVTSTRICTQTSQTIRSRFVYEALGLFQKWLILMRRRQTLRE